MKSLPCFRNLLSAALFTALLASPTVHAAIAFAGVDSTTGGAWRSTGTAKALDADGDNVYGTAGYATSGSWTAATSPAFLNFTAFGTAFTAGFMADWDDPTQPISAAVSDVDSGERFFNSAAGFFDFYQITLTADAHFRMGVASDGHFAVDEFPDVLRISQTAGGSDSVTTADFNANNNNSLDYYFFDIDGQAGDTYLVSGMLTTGNNGFISMLDLLTFDELPADAVPAPGILALSLLLLPLLRRRLTG